MMRLDRRWLLSRSRIVPSVCFDGPTEEKTGTVVADAYLRAQHFPIRMKE